MANTPEDDTTAKRGAETSASGAAEAALGGVAAPAPAGLVPSPGGTSLREPPVVPPWLANAAALGWRVVAIAALVIVLWQLATILWVVTAAIAVATVIAALFAPAVLRLRAGGRSRNAAAAIVWAAAIVAIGGVLLLLVYAFLPYLADVVRRLEAGLTDLQARIDALGIPPLVGELVRDLLDLARSATGVLDGGVAAWVAGAVTVMILATFLVFFFLRDGDRAWFWTFQGVTDAKRERITAAGEDALHRVGGYLRGTTVLSGIIALTDLVFMTLLGVPLAVPLSVLAFLSGYIPYFGGIVTTTIILLVALAAQGPGTVVALLVLITIRNVLLGYGVRPALYGRSVSLHPALVLLVLPAGYQLAGVIGLFAAVPVTAVAFAVASAAVAIVEPDPPPPLPGLVPAWLDRVAQWSWRILVVIAFLALLVAAFLALPMVLLPVVIATILVATLDPVVRALMRRGSSRARAAAIALGGGFLAASVMVFLAVASVVAYAQPIAEAAFQGAVNADDATGGQLGALVDLVGIGARQTVQTAASIAQAIGSIAVIVVLSALLAFYLLRDGSSLWDRFVARARPDAVPALHEAGSRAFEVLGGYMGGTAAISFVGAASQLVIMLVLGIDLALPIFVLSFFLGFIPYIGGFISTGIAFLVTVATGTPTDIVIMAIWTLVFNLVTGNIVSPIVYGKTVHLHPAVVLVGIPAGSAVAGVLGMFLVVPAIGVVAATWRTVLSVMGARDASAAAVGEGAPTTQGPEPEPSPP